jgi:hypothetical protein
MRHTSVNRRARSPFSGPIVASGTPRLAARFPSGTLIVVPCKTCGAPTDVSCHSSGGGPSQVHINRRREALAIYWESTRRLTRDIETETLSTYPNFRNSTGGDSHVDV